MIDLNTASSPAPSSSGSTVLPLSPYFSTVPNSSDVQEGFDAVCKTKKNACEASPVAGPGNWRGEILGGGTFNFGQVVQHNPGRQSVEFSYLVISAIFTPPEKQFTWPGVVLIFAPTPMKSVHPDAGRLLSAKRLLSLGFSLEVTRDQFSDLLRMFEASGVPGLSLHCRRGCRWLMASPKLGHVRRASTSKVAGLQARRRQLRKS